MSKDEDKLKHSKRLQKEENAIHKQQRIAKAHGAPEHQYESHRYAKHHALNCGDALNWGAYYLPKLLR